jgi:hypothetical protein
VRISSETEAALTIGFRGYRGVASTGLGILPSSFQFFYSFSSVYHPNIQGYTFLKNAVFWDVTPCGSCISQRFASIVKLQLLVTASVAPSALILSILMKEAISSSETSVLTRATRRQIAEDGTVKEIQ